MRIQLLESIGLSEYAPKRTIAAVITFLTGLTIAADGLQNLVVSLLSSVHAYHIPTEGIRLGIGIALISLAFGFRQWMRRSRKHMHIGHQSPTGKKYYISIVPSNLKLAELILEPHRSTAEEIFFLYDKKSPDPQGLKESLRKSGWTCNIHLKQIKNVENTHDIKEMFEAILESLDDRKPSHIAVGVKPGTVASSIVLYEMAKMHGISAIEYYFQDTETLGVFEFTPTLQKAATKNQP
ncbi:hypothetical protein LGV61_05425 [Desulfurispirillum indicum]|uniref:hypothetical protein n=1 Tax=Desulfurispirillum indicum TaxID=936456 RepID=UPI001CFB6EFA|nr:hypothetical protein [Desulfurispirillum indicum]UCZ57716.1 hypothetical protein LGV61_05425 [Desulfurispirillum indicum]